MVESSLLFGAERPELASEPPPFFGDLNLDQLVARLTAGREIYALDRFWFTPLTSTDAIARRHEVFRDLETGPLRERVQAFASGMRATRERLERARTLHYTHRCRRWFLDAARTYCDAVDTLRRDLTSCAPSSRGLREILDHIERYTASPEFVRLNSDERDVRGRLSEVRYTLEIAGSKVKVARYEGEDDYGAEVSATFAKFRQATVKEYRLDRPRMADMNHVEAGVLDRVALLFPDAFGALAAFCSHHAEFIDETIAAFDREVQFYLAYLELADRLRNAGLDLCHPRIDDQSKAECVRETFDIVLADKLERSGKRIVTNDFELADDERIIVVSGPNQGGKTTFARTFGQLHYLAALGCPVPGSAASLFLTDRIFTHFEHEERLEDLSGKLQDDLLRVRDILSRATPDSVVVLNEIFTSTSLSDAAFLGTRVLEALSERGCLCACVTFVEELASLDDAVVSMVSTVDPADPAVRTFKVVRRHADGLAYAVAIAEKYRLTYGALKERISA